MVITNMRTRQFALAAMLLTTYVLIEINWTITSMYCQRNSFKDLLQAVQENNVILEFATYGFDCLRNSSVDANCGKIEMNETRTAVNGKTWYDDDKDELIQTLDENPTEKKELPVIRSKYKVLQKLLCNQFKNCVLIYPHSIISAEKYLSNKIVENLIEENRRQRYPLFLCNQVNALFEPKKLKKDFRLVEEQDSKRDVHYKEGITIYRGHINHPVLGYVACYLKEARRKEPLAIAYHVLLNERSKYMFLGTDTKVTGRLIGECVTHDLVRIVVESVEAESLCDDEQEFSENYVLSKCYESKKLTELVERHEDKTRAAFVFIREILCMFSEIERKQFFVQDIHGKHFSVMKNMSVFLNSIDNLAYHGSRNILSGSICKYDEECPSPMGELWSNGSANRAVYEKCFDINPYCVNTCCSGFNASLHICGVSRWIVQRLYPFFKRIQDRSRISNVMMSMMNSYSFLRHNATDMCEKTTLYLSIYDKDMALAKKNPGGGRSFHVKQNPK